MKKHCTIHTDKCIGKLCAHDSNLHFAFKRYLKDLRVGKQCTCNVVFYLSFLQPTEYENDKKTAVSSVCNDVFTLCTLRVL